MQKKSLLLALIIFIAVATVSYFVTQPVAQIGPNSAPGECDLAAFEGIVSYLGSGCEWRDGDKIRLHKWNGSSWVFIGTENLVLYQQGYAQYAFASGDVPGAGSYRLLPEIQLAAGFTGINPALRYASYNGCNGVFQRDFDVIACVQQ